MVQILLHLRGCGLKGKSSKQPRDTHLPNLIIEAHMDNPADVWHGYNRKFRQRAAADPSMCWAMVDPTLSSLAFSGRVKVSRCKHCFSLTHAPADCKRATPDKSAHSSCVHLATSVLIGTKTRASSCSCANCTYQHVCTYCAQDLSILNKFHKSVFCPYHTVPERKGGDRFRFIWGQQTRQSYRN